MKKSILIGILLVCELLAAMQTGSIGGAVIDSTNALIPGAQVTMEHLGTGEQRQTITNDTGSFQFLAVSPGKVRISVSLPGFKTAVYEIEVTSQHIQMKATLTLASVSTSVEVTTISNLPLVSSNAVSITTRSGTQNAGPRRARRDLVDRGPRQHNTESYDHIQDNPFIRVSNQPRSTFAADVDTASYANVRRFLNSGSLPPKDAVRIEELVNYFKYPYQVPSGAHPVAIHTEVAPAFWQPKHRLVRVGLRARDIDLSVRKAANLVFLIDVSGSMQSEAKLPLVKRSLRLLVDQLRDDDYVSMVVYAGSSGLVLSPTPGTRKPEIHSAIEMLEAGGSTNGGEGIQLAYRMATENFIRGGINRVILATDGDFNVGVTNEGDLVRLVQEKAKSGVFLSVLGYGIGNYKDSTLEKLADKGHGNYAYIDTIQEARRVLVEQLSGTLLAVAKDVKLQVEFNPSEVQAYRLIGYENRILRDEDFEDDSKQGGDMGAGHNVTALFEIVPVGVPFDESSGRPLKYQDAAKAKNARKGELLTVSIRYKQPDGNRSTLLEVVATDARTPFESASEDFRFVSSVAAFGMLLRDSPHKGDVTFDALLEVAEKSAGSDASRAEFVNLARKASVIPR